MFSSAIQLNSAVLKGWRDHLQSYDDYSKSSEDLDLIRAAYLNIQCTAFFGKGFYSIQYRSVPYKVSFDWLSKER